MAQETSSLAKDPFYITTAISYLNGKPHLGHAYEMVITDAMARFKRLDGHDVMFLTGTDEHGEKVAMTAEKNGISPKDFTDSLAPEFTGLAERLNLSHDDFIRTTEPRHYEASKALWNIIKDHGDIYLENYAGWYSVQDEAYFGEDELSEGDDGHKYAPSGARVVWKEEPSYFFRLSKYTDKLLAYYDENPDFIQPETRRNEVISFVKGGLRDLSISRTSLTWGIPVPDDDKHVMYVWLDALTNYLTGIGYPDQDTQKLQKFWPANYHVIGKDITRFHAVYWPAFLMAADLPLPKTIFAHGFINIEGRKMSKSLGNVLSPDVLLEDFGTDQTRYILSREISHGQDGNFSHNHAVERINSDLANGLGNLSQRSLSMIYKNCDAQIPQISQSDLTDDDKALLAKAHNDLADTCRAYFNKFEIHKALVEIIHLSSLADSYIDSQAPWKLKKEDPARMKVVLYVLAEVIRCLAIAIQPVTPQGANKILDQLKVPDDKRLYAHITVDNALVGGVDIDKPEGVFPRVADKEEAAA